MGRMRTLDRLLLLLLAGHSSQLHELMRESPESKSDCLRNAFDLLHRDMQSLCNMRWMFQHIACD